MIEYNRTDDVEYRLDSLSRFIFHWYGIGKKENPSSSFKISLPYPLEYIYRYYEIHFRQLITYNRFVGSHDLIHQSGGVRFYAEATGVYIWQIQNIEGDPNVFISENKKPLRWMMEEECLCGFLFQIFVYEAMMSSKYHCMSSWMDKKRLYDIMKSWTPCPFRYWQWPAYPAKFYQIDNALAFIYPNHDGFTIQCGSNDPLSLQFMKPFIDERWEDNNVIY